MSINRVNISGNLTRSAELRQTASGVAVASFGVAVNDRRKNSQTGEWEDVPNYVDCTLYGQRAQAIAQYLAKGTKVAIDGKLRYSSWEKDGHKRSKLEVIVDELEFMSRRDDGGSQPRQQQAQQRQQAPREAYGTGYARQDSNAAPSVYDEDIPF